MKNKVAVYSLLFVLVGGMSSVAWGMDEEKSDKGKEVVTFKTAYPNAYGYVSKKKPDADVVTDMNNMWNRIVTKDATIKTLTEQNDALKNVLLIENITADGIVYWNKKSEITPEDIQNHKNIINFFNGALVTTDAGKAFLQEFAPALAEAKKHFAKSSSTKQENPEAEWKRLNALKECILGNQKTFVGIAALLALITYFTHQNFDSIRSILPSMPSSSSVA